MTLPFLNIKHWRRGQQVASSDTTIPKHETLSWRRGQQALFLENIFLLTACNNKALFYATIYLCPLSRLKYPSLVKIKLYKTGVRRKIHSFDFSSENFIRFSKGRNICKLSYETKSPEDMF